MLRPLATVCGVLLTLSHAGAQGLTIDHQPVGCLVADNFPELNACFQPSSEVARARLQFRAEGTIHWYYVEMQQGGACFSATLPKPKASTKGLEYYIDVASKSYGESRTPDYNPRVASGLGGCKRRGIVASFVTTAAVRVFAPTGAPAIPAGFSGAGITTITAASTGPGTASASGAGGSGGGAESDAGAQAKKGSEPKMKSGGGGGGAGVVLGVLALGAAGGAVYYTTQKKDEEETDDDGDGVSEKDGDCDDTRRDVSPSGGFTFTVDFAWTGSNACNARNPRAQTYRIQNNSCTPLTIRDLGIMRTYSGSLCGNIGTESEKLAPSASTVPGGASTVIRTGAGAGTAGAICCATGRCTGSCTINETVLVVTSSGNASATNSFQVTDPNASQCPSCSGPPLNDWPFSGRGPTFSGEAASTPFGCE